MQDIVNSLDIANLGRMDKQFFIIFEKYGSPPNWKKAKSFISLCQIILAQQVSLESADAHFKKLNGYLSPFEPDEILKLSDEEMRKCQISRQKAKYLRALAGAVSTNKLDLDKLELLEEPEIRTELLKIKGIGTWTADIYLMFCMQMKDVFPSGDIAVVNTVKELYNVTEKEEVLRISNNWKPLRSLASYFLWHYYLKSKNKY